MNVSLDMKEAEGGFARPRPSFSPSSSDVTDNINPDADRLAAMGYSQDMKRNFSMWSVLGVGFSLTNSWFGISTALVTGINSGGAILVIYGIILVAIVSTCVGISLAELASALPNAGEKYASIVDFVLAMAKF
jgi:choline transport protein